MKKLLKNAVIFVLAFVILFTAACNDPEVKEKYTVTFNSMSGSAIVSQTVEEGQKATKPSPDPTRSGYTFEQWHTDEACTALYSFDTAVNANLTLYAKWVEVPTPEYTVTFNSKGGSSVQPQTVEEGQKATKPSPDPTYANHNFAQWYKDEAYTQLYDFNAAVTGALTLYAKWTPIPQFAVAFNSGGGTAIDEQLIYENGKVTKPADPTRINYDFDGWYYDHDEDGLIEERPWDFDTFTVTGSLILNAHWIQTHYEVKFVTNTDTEIDDQSVEFGGKIVAPAVLTKEGYTFVNWYTSVAYTTVWDFDNVLDQDRTLHARWFEKKTVDADLSDWSEDELENYVVVRGAANETRGATLYAKYIRGHGLFLAGYFDHNANATGGSSSEWWRRPNLEMHINGSANLQLGRGTPADSSVNHIGNLPGTDNPTRPSAARLITRARTEEGNEFFPNNFRSYFEIFVTYESIPNRVDNGAQRIGFSCMSSHTNNTVALAGSGPETAALGGRQADYNWCRNGLSPNGVDKSSGFYVYDDVVDRGIYDNADRDAIAYTIMFDANGGSAVLPQEIEIGGKIEEPAVPSNPGYNLVGWYKSSNFTISAPTSTNTNGGGNYTDAEWDFDTDIVLEGYMLYAKWEPSSTNDYTVRFESNGATSGAPADITSQTIGSLIAKPANPVKTGFIFIDWYANEDFEGNAWSFSSDRIAYRADKVFTLYAFWQEQENFTITFNTDGGSVIAPASVLTGEYIEEPADPTKEGFIFAGWYQNEGKTQSWNFATDKVLGNINLYARWFEGKGEVMGIRDDRGTGQGFDVAAWIVAGGVEIRYVVHHNSAVVTNASEWHTNTNFEFWVDSTQYFYTLGSQANSLNGGTATSETVAGSKTTYITYARIFLPNAVAIDGLLRMQFAAKPAGNAEQMKITGFTATGGMDAWWMVSRDTVRAYRGEGNTFSGLGNSETRRFYVYSDGMHLNAK